MRKIKQFKTRISTWTYVGRIEVEKVGVMVSKEEMKKMIQSHERFLPEVPESVNKVPTP